MGFDRMRRWPSALALTAVLLAVTPVVLAQSNSSTPIPQSDTWHIDPDGTTHVTRVIPVPKTISPEAQKFISNPAPVTPEPNLAIRRAHNDAFRISQSKKALQLFPVNVKSETLGGVRCDLITPLTVPAEKRGRVLINLHGGGFNADSGSLVEGVPIAYLTRTPVVSVYYRLAPEHPFPAAVDDAVAVYKALLKTHHPQEIAIFGTSAGAILTGEVAVKLKREGVPLPGALGIFSGTGDMSQPDDSRNTFTLAGYRGPLHLLSTDQIDPDYVGKANRKDPVLSPIYADLHGMPPTLFITSTRDLLLSGTTNLDRAFLRAGNRTQLVVFEALPHAFWYHYELPETKEALGIMARFFDENLSR